MNAVKTIEKYIWVLNLLLLFLVAYFLAGFINFQMSKKYMTPQAASIRKSQPIFAMSGMNYHPPASKIIEGNVFGTIPQPPPGMEGGATVEMQVANVDAELMGVIYFSMDNPLNQATIRLKQDNKMEVYKAGDELMPGAKVSEIWPEQVVLKYANGRTQELLFQFGQRLPLGMEAPPPGSYIDPYSSMSPAERERALREYRKTLGIDDKIQRVSDSYYKIKKEAIEKAMGNLNEIVTQARMVPNFTMEGQNRKVDGFRIFKIVPGSIFDKLGMHDGDVIRRINGADMDSVEKAFELMQSLRFEKKFDIDIIRGGNQPTTMSYQVVD